MQQPLPTLLSNALAVFTREYDRQRQGTLHAPSLVVWSNVLRLIDDSGVDLRRLSELAVLSKRAVRVAVRDLEYDGWLELVPVEGRKSPTFVTLTDAGRTARDVARRFIGATEMAWQKTFGKDRIETLRSCLWACDGYWDVELPHYITGYGQGDGSMTGGSYHPERLEPHRIPAHGQEWPVVMRDRNAEPANFPLSALLSRALTAFTIDYDREGKGGLGIVSAVLQYITDDGIPLGQASLIGDVSGTGRSGLERHRIVEVEPGKHRDPDRLVRLTEGRGKPWRDAYPVLVRDIEKVWAKRANVTDLRDALEAVSASIEPDFRPYPRVCEWLAKPRLRRKRKT